MFMIEKVLHVGEIIPIVLEMYNSQIESRFKNCHFTWSGKHIAECVVLSEIYL